MHSVRENVVARLGVIFEKEELDNVESWPAEIEEGIMLTLKKEKGSQDLDLKKNFKKQGKKNKSYYPIKEHYLTLARKITSNLSLCPNKDDLIDRLLEGLVNPRELASMPHIELDPNNFQAQRTKELEDEENKGNRRWKTKTVRGMNIKIPYDIIESVHEDGTVTKEEIEVPDGMLTCGKCKMKKTSSYEMQTRSADEPMTIFATCLCCGHRWRF